MKTLSDGNMVSAKSYYYLLEFNNIDNWRYIQDNFNKMKLHNLTLSEYIDLFKHATEDEISYLRR